MSEKEYGRDDNELHIHRWSLLKNPEFYAMGELINRHLFGVHPISDCPHVDSPLVDSVETLAYVIVRESGIPDHPILRQQMMQMLQTMGNTAFTAGIRFGRDGHRLDNDKISDAEIPEIPPDGAFNDERDDNLSTWRESVREAFYRPADKAAKLAKLIEKLQSGEVTVIGGGNSNTIGIMMSNHDDSDPTGEGFYV